MMTPEQKRLALLRERQRLEDVWSVLKALGLMLAVSGALIALAKWGWMV